MKQRRRTRSAATSLAVLSLWACSEANSPDCPSYPTCGAGTETVLCTVQNGMHCGNYSSFMIPQVAWGVLKNEALP